MLTNSQQLYTHLIHWPKKLSIDNVYNKPVDIAMITLKWNLIFIYNNHILILFDTKW